ncbi:MAG: peptidoglycan-binding protein [Candidatus Omnitrophica bacterium]|nr:peptidoglycan-binding protein [Candidatus Omnitrophota bacterium]
MFFRLIIGVVLVGSLVGCATTQKPTTVNQLQIRVAQVESRLDDRERDAAELKYAVEELVVSVEKLVGSVGSVNRPSRSATVSSTKASQPGPVQILRVPVTPQEVQTALKKSGYYDGAIDGKLGSGSQKAIKAFQKDHDLESDGIVGKKTWADLKNYLE